MMEKIRSAIVEAVSKHALVLLMFLAVAWFLNDIHSQQIEQALQAQQTLERIKMKLTLVME